MISFRSLTIVTYFWFFVLLFILVIWKDALHCTVLAGIGSRKASFVQENNSKW